MIFRGHPQCARDCQQHGDRADYIAREAARRIVAERKDTPDQVHTDVRKYRWP